MENCNHSAVRTCDDCTRLFCLACDTPTFYMYRNLCRNCDSFYYNTNTVKCLGDEKLWYPPIPKQQEPIKLKRKKENHWKYWNENSPRVHSSNT